MRRRKYGWDVYVIAFVILSVHIANIVAKFMGKDVGISIPESLQAISTQVEHIAIAYVFFRSQRQVNRSHKRISKITTPEGLEDPQ